MSLKELLGNETAKFILQALIKYGPATARELLAIFKKQEIKDEDWEKVFLAAETKSYDDYMNAAK